jgi:hypothetical protein
MYIMYRTNIFKGKLDFPDNSPGAKNYFKTFLKLLNFAFKNVVFYYSKQSSQRQK